MRVWTAQEFPSGTFKCLSLSKIISRLLRMEPITDTFFKLMIVKIIIEVCADFGICTLIENILLRDYNITPLVFYLIS